MEQRNFLVELGTEELPPTALLTLATAFANSVEEQLRATQIAFTDVVPYATPRRLALYISDLASMQPDRTEEKLGPNVSAAFDADGNPSKAAQGFARGCGVDVSELDRVPGDKGERLAFRTVVKGQHIQGLMSAIIAKALASLPIPKRMRWGASRTEFVRPAHWLVMLYGSDVVDGEVLGLQAGRTTRGHRFHCKAPFDISDADSYLSSLREQGTVEADFHVRQANIKQQVSEAGQQVGGVAVIDDDLLEEVTALVEHPVALTGRFEERFLAVPQEALIFSMKEHQKYFPVIDGEGKLLPYFITVANLASRDPQQIIKGNERVIRPRLSDAAFFFETDKKISLESRRENLKTVLFQQQLGSIFDKTERIAALASSIASQIDGDAALAARAGQLSKADLVSDMVLEFDKMQGIAGQYYALNDGENAEVAQALSEQYLPKFAGDKLPSSKTGLAIALADRIDTLVGIFGIGQPPSGTKDPFALRRASLGILRIIIENKLNLDLRECLSKAAGNFDNLPKADSVVDDVFAYINDRFRARYSEQGIAVEVFNAVNAKGLTAPSDIEARVLAVNEFVKLPEAEALAAANKRVANILAKQSADESLAQQDIQQKLLSEAAEIALASAVTELSSSVTPLIIERDYTQALQVLARLREPVDNFFDSVMVLADDQDVRNNRLILLSKLRSLFWAIADISQLANTK